MVVAVLSVGHAIILKYPWQYTGSVRDTCLNELVLLPRRCAGCSRFAWLEDHPGVGMTSCT